MISFSLLTKSYLATALLVLALAQLTVIGLALGWFGHASPLSRRRLRLFHRFEGYIALLIILTIAYDCVFVIHPRLTPPRVTIHSFLGPAVIGLILAKFVTVRLFPRRFRLLPPMGLSLFIAIVAIWITSAAWYFTSYGFTI